LLKKVVKPDPGGEDATVIFLGDSFDLISGFPNGVKRNLGHGIRCVQAGVAPPDSKAITTIGLGVYELRDSDKATWYRVIYLKKIENTVYILHCFSKKSRKTSMKDLRTAQLRLKALHKELSEENRK